MREKEKEGQSVVEEGRIEKEIEMQGKKSKV